MTSSRTSSISIAGAIALVIIFVIVVAYAAFSAYLWLVGATVVLGVSMLGAAAIYVAVLLIIFALRQIVKEIS